MVTWHGQGPCGIRLGLARVPRGGNCTPIAHWLPYRVINFKPITARNFRLNIQKANEVPTIEEFELYPPGTIKGE